MANIWGELLTGTVKGMRKAGKTINDLKTDGLTNTIAKRYYQNSKKVQAKVNQIEKSLADAKKKLQSAEKNMNSGGIKKAKAEIKKLEKQQKYYKNGRENGLKNGRLHKALKFVAPGGKWGIFGELGNFLKDAATQTVSNVMSDVEMERNIKNAVKKYADKANADIGKSIRMNKKLHGENARLSDIFLRGGMQQAEVLDFLRQVYVIVETKSGYNEQDLNSLISLMKSDEDRKLYAKHLSDAMKSNSGKAYFLKLYGKKLEEMKTQRIKKVANNNSELRRLLQNGKDSEIFKSLALQNINTLEDLSELVNKFGLEEEDDPTVSDAVKIQKNNAKLFARVANALNNNSGGMSKFLSRYGEKMTKGTGLSPEAKSLQNIEAQASSVNDLLRDRIDQLNKYMTLSPHYVLFERGLEAQNRQINGIRRSIEKIQKALVDDQDTSIKTPPKIEVKPVVNVNNDGINQRLDALEKAVQSQNGGILSTMTALGAMGAGLAAMYGALNLLNNDEDGSGGGIHTALELAGLGALGYGGYKGIKGGRGLLRARKLRMLKQMRAERQALRESQRGYSAKAGYGNTTYDYKFNHLEKEEKPIHSNQYQQYKNTRNKHGWKHKAFNTITPKEYLNGSYKFKKPAEKLNYNTIDMGNRGYNLGGDYGYKYNNLNTVHRSPTTMAGSFTYNQSPRVQNIPKNNIITKTMQKISPKFSTTAAKSAGKSMTSVFKKLAAPAPRAGLLNVAMTGLDVYDVISSASNASSKTEREQILGEGLTRASVSLAGSTAGAFAGAFLGGLTGPLAPLAVPLGAAIGSYAGDWMANELLESDIGKSMIDTGIEVAKWTDDNDIMEELDDKGIIDYDYFGKSKILDKEALSNLSPADLRKLIDFDDFDEKDIAYLKYLLSVKTNKAEKVTKETVDKDMRALREELSDIESRVAKYGPEASRAFRALMANPNNVLTGNNQYMKKLAEFDPALADMLKAYVIKENAQKDKAENAIGISKSELDKKYHLGMFSNGYLSSEVQPTVAEKKLADIKKAVENGECLLSDVSLDHMADDGLLDSANAKYANYVSEKYGIDDKDQPRYTGNFKIVGGKKLNSNGTKVRGPYTNHKARGIRNNNPGNMRISNPDIDWLGKVPLQYNTDHVFEQFVLPEFGIRALAMNLKNYQAKYRLYTVRGMITKYAPSCENNTSSYIQTVAKAIGVGPDDRIDFRDPNVNYPMICAIIGVENGECPYPEQLIKRSISAGLGVEELTVDTAEGVMSAKQYDANEGISYNQDGTTDFNSRVNSNKLNVSAPTIDAKELGSYTSSRSEVDLAHLNPEFASRLASATKEFEEKTGHKLNITSGYRSDFDQARLYALMKAGDKGVLKCARPANDVFIKYGEVLSNPDSGFSFKVDSTKLQGVSGITHGDGGITIKGGGHSAHNIGCAVDISKSDISDFKTIAEKYGIGQTESGDPVHFELARALRGKSGPNPISSNPNIAKSEQASPTVDNSAVSSSKRNVEDMPINSQTSSSSQAGASAGMVGDLSDIDLSPEADDDTTAKVLKHMMAVGSADAYAYSFFDPDARKALKDRV